MDAETESLAIELIRGLRVDVAELHLKLDGMKGELFGEIGSLRTDLRAEFESLRANIASDLSNFHAGFSEQIAGLHLLLLEYHSEVVAQTATYRNPDGGPQRP